MYAVPVDVLRFFIWVWLVSLVCIIKLYLMLVLMKRLYENYEKPWILEFSMVL